MESEGNTIMNMLWAGEMLLLPAVGVIITILWYVRSIKKSSDKLLYMHYHPDEFEFGSRELTEHLQKMEHSMKMTAHWCKWMATNMNKGKEPAPPLDS